MFKVGDLVTLGDYFGVVIETLEYSCVVRWVNPINNSTNPSFHGYKMLCKVS
jgi:hypothetical protein